MTWFRVDDAWWSHPKVAALSLAARGLWVTAGSWCAQHLQDGKVPRGVLAMLGGTAKIAAELVAAALWEIAPGGWLIHDWHKYQPSRADVEKEREQKRLRQKKWRGKDGAVDASTDTPTNPSQAAPVTPAPARAFSRPVPSRPEAADAASCEPAAACVFPDLPIGSGEVAAAWHSALQQPGGGDLLTMHAERSWRADFETIAVVINQVAPAARATALAAVCRWFWLAPDGPIQTGRISRKGANPGHLAKRISSDLKRANEWFAAQREAAQ